MRSPDVSDSKRHLQFATEARTTAGSLRARRRLLVGVLSTVVVLDLAAALFAHERLEFTTRERVRSVLESALATEVEGAEEWFAVRLGRLATIVGTSEFEAAAAALAAAPDSPASREPLLALADGFSLGGRRRPWAYAAPDGRVLVDEATLGARLPDHLTARLQSGAAEPRIVLPGEAAAGEPRGFALSPARVRDQVVGWLVIPLELEEFSRGPFAARRVMASGELYAFDAQGRMLSESRFPEPLRKSGVLPPSATSTVLTLDLRDPGVDLEAGERPGAARSALPFTRPVAAALGGVADGADFEGYRDYRGALVYGAWHWFPRYGFGLVIELDEAEALAPVAIVRPLLTGLFVAMGLVLAGMAWLYVRSKSAEERARRLLDETKRLGQYELVRKLGEGGMGVVYEARHALLHRPAAIKLMQAGTLTEEQLARFDREAQATASLSHPNTISVYDFGRSHGGGYYYVMELLFGADLERLVRETGPLPEARVVHVLKQVCGSLAEAHLRGLVHRDVKPANLFLTARPGVYDVAKVLDFGLVHVKSGGKGLTSAHLVMGTPLYMAPETFEGAHRASPASDLYALGAVAYWLVTGKPVFDDGRHLPDLMMDHRTRTPTPAAELLGRALDPALQAFIDACLQKDPALRPASMAAAAALLDGFAGAWREHEAKAWWESRGTVLVDRPSDVAPAGPALATDAAGTADTFRAERVELPRPSPPTRGDR